MFLTTNDPNVRRIVSKVCKRYEIDNDLVSESKFMDEILTEYIGNENLAELEGWLDREIPLKFPALNKRPFWLQAAEWPFANGQPMIFLGQIDIGTENTPDFRKYFHDHTSLYVFMPQGQGRFEVIMQQM